jgi:pilus assembly protein CpaF
VLTIRRFRPRGFTPDDLVANGTVTRATVELLGRAVAARCTLLVCGGTGSGKTTTLGALASYVDPAERVVTIEDAAELKLPLPHVIRLESRPPNLEGRGEVTIRRLVRNALRMRPDRLIVGEVRGPEALDLLVALSTGHAGSLCTIHAGSAAEALRRLETLALMADVGLPLAAIRDQIADAIDLVVRQERGADGARRVVEVAEVVRAAGGPAVRDLLTLRAGRTVAGAPISDALAARLAPRGSLARVAAAARDAAAPQAPEPAPAFLPPEAPP